ncbi:hypothetical protein [Streptomyces sp. NPDC059165]|uniref:hypothetical protein n=1 Tax=Streptomyces sp. NPDC059165 TaxID=3346751 RepID=UPI00369C7216
MTRRVTGHVHVTSKDGTRRSWLAPGDEVPPWASVDDRLVEGAAEKSAPSRTGSSSSGEVSEPPRAGKGSGLDAWQRYADSRGIGYDAEMSRDDVIAVVDAANSSARE